MEINLCFRVVNRAGHINGCSEPNLHYELYGLLHKAGCSLATDGLPKGKVI